jgi:nucleoside phosphorylase
LVTLKSSAQDISLVSCVNATFCLDKAPKLVIVERGVSANVFVDNAAYRTFLHSKFNASPVDMESAGVALVNAVLAFTFRPRRLLEPD